ncbi:sulfurtransferase [Marinibactrum halimedae]|uniref:Rhodanese domain-containing protein n=1 Tax=Marinibactrum halimedae TaxID=1444977 RepID=A0AA37T358_9GAMM|nr:rhodanese-like domain-containing protein [Marinibactrum halimedae]MCD9459732.1 sulfurtransferase [Marinibactrum halimedae]GLS24511.1 hypothetical protein GCM10007877_02230 [Marinibactrum halimedae]
MSSLPLLIEPAELASLLEQGKADSQPSTLLIIDLCQEAQYHAGHLPGAIYVSPRSLVAGTPPAPGKLPNEEQLTQLARQIGLTPNTHVIAYDDEGGGWAGRFLWTLEIIGHHKFSYLNGGLHAWAGESLPMENTVNTATPSDYDIALNFTPRATVESILSGLESHNLMVWDARGADEYRGEKVLAAKGGHIPGAIHCEWTELMDRNAHLKIRRDAREYLQQKGIDGSLPIATHCQSHHRSGFTYLVGKILGFEMQGYDGSWSEWGNHPDTPVER